MASESITELDVLISLNQVIPSLELVLDKYSKAENTDALPQAFPAVMGHLKLVLTTYVSIQSFLESSGEEAQALEDSYSKIQRASSECFTKIRHITTYVLAVTYKKSDESPVACYHSAVRKVGGSTIEKYMEEILDGLIGAVKKPMVSQEQINKLEEAYIAVQSLPPSMESDHHGQGMMINYGPGNQYLHSGRGDQNNVTGGVQITGQNTNAKYRFGNKDLN